MGNRNHLHVCRHCGVVHANSSSANPRKCWVCDGIVFSEYDPNEILDENERLEETPRPHPVESQRKVRTVA